MDFIYKWQVSALLFDEYCILHIVMEVYVVLHWCIDNTVVWCVDVQRLYSFAALGASLF